MSCRLAVTRIVKGTVWSDADTDQRPVTWHLEICLCPRLIIEQVGRVLSCLINGDGNNFWVWCFVKFAPHSYEHYNQDYSINLTNCNWRQTFLSLLYYSKLFIAAFLGLTLQDNLTEVMPYFLLPLSFSMNWVFMYKYYTWDSCKENSKSYTGIWKSYLNLFRLCLGKKESTVF